MTGKVKEYFKLTEISELSSLEKLTSLINLPSPIEIRLPLPKTGWEKYEGMLVKFPQELTVTDNYFLGQYGEISLSSKDRLFIPTQKIDPNDEFLENNSSDGFSNQLTIF